MKVKDISVSTFWKGEARIEGLVEEEETYKAQVYIKGSQIYDYSCSCAKGNSYKGMCSHAKALMEAYRLQEADFNKKTVVTSQGVRFMIREYTNREVSKIISEGEEEKVNLIPSLLASRREVKLVCKVGRDRMYLVKDLAAFVQAVEYEKTVEYGKGLSFRHSMDIFTEESRPLVQLIVELVHVCQEHYEQFQKNSAASCLALKELSLNKANRDKFLALMENRVLEVEDYQGLKRRVLVTLENPSLEIEVKREGRDGCRVSVPHNLMAFQGEESLYLVDKGRVSRCSPEYTKVLSVFLEQMLNVYGADGEVLVNDKDMPLFYERVLKKMELLGLVHAMDVNLEDYRPDELKVRFEFDSENPNQLSMRPVLSYGGFSFHPVEDEKLPRTVCRDVPGEFRVSQLITKYFKYKEQDTKNLVIKDDEESMYRLLSEGMEEFMALGDVFLSDSFKNLKVLPPPKISIGVSTVNNWLELEIDAGDMTGQELGRVLAEYSQKKKFYRMKNGQFLELGDNGMATIAKLMEGLSLSKSDLYLKQIRLPRYRALYLDSIVKEGPELSYYRDAMFKSIVRGMKSVEDSDYEIPPSLKEVLRGYQKEGFKWLRTLDYYGFGGILADDMGLGKTIQIIALLLDEKINNRGNYRPSLIICPASLVYNWESEIALFAPGLKAVPVAGTASERAKLLEQAASVDVVITSYDLLKRDIILYQGRSFRFEVIDEAQYIKNASTQSAKAVKAIDAGTRFALTGTPIENRLSELWSIFDYLMPGFLFGYQRFKKLFEAPIMKNQDQAALMNLHRMTGPFVLRRLKQDVLKELPDKLETILYSKMGDKQNALYAANAILLKQQLEAGGTSGREKIQILAELLKLRQICCDPALCYQDYRGESAKLEACVDLVVNGMESEHKILLFSQFTSMLEIIGERLKKEGIPFYLLTGATPKEERLKMVNSFHNDGIPVFLISLKAGGTGLNLTAADIVIHYDPWWNVAAQNQATDRAHRIGQEKQVTVFKLITRNTIEENILKLQDSKKDLAEQVITEGTVSFGSLSKEDLLQIIGG